MLRQIYKKAINNGYDADFPSFIKDFSNCREAFTTPQIAFSYKIERELSNKLKLFYGRKENKNVLEN